MPTQPSLPKSIWVTIVIALLSLVMSGYNGYNNNDRANVQRITAVEAKQTNSDQRLDRIENKLDQILEEVYSNRESNQQKLEDLIRVIQTSRPAPRVPNRSVPPPLPQTLPPDPPPLK